MIIYLTNKPELGNTKCVVCLKALKKESGCRWYLENYFKFEGNYGYCDMKCCKWLHYQLDEGGDKEEALVLIQKNTGWERK